jgi:hypothetical protein
LLNSELASREGQIAASAATKMKEVHDLAEPMRARLDGHAAGHFQATGHTPSKSGYGAALVSPAGAIAPLPARYLLGSQSLHRRNRRGPLGGQSRGKQGD